MPSFRANVVILIVTVSVALVLLGMNSPRGGQDDRTIQAEVVTDPAPLPPAIEALRYDDPRPGDPRGQRQRLPDLFDGRTRPAPGGYQLQPIDPDRPFTPEDRILTIDRATGRVYEQDLPGLAELLRPYTDAGIGLQELVDDPEGVVKNFSGWTRVTTPDQGDFPRRVKLKMWARATNGILYGPYGCSGTLIDPMHVLTAAHCIWFHDDADAGLIFNSYIEEVLVIPGYEDGDEPFGHAMWAEMHVWGNWIDDHDYDHDIGIIDLNRPVGALAGWWGYGYSEDCDFFESVNWLHAGYPGWEPANGEIMYQASGDYDDCYLPTFKRVAWDNSSGNGTSGSGALKTSTGAIYGVHSTGTDVHSTDCVLTPFKFIGISQMISDDKASTLDLHALDVNSDAAVVSGFRPSFFNFAVLNYSHAAGSGDWGFNIYLSDDTNITSIDTYLGSGTFNQIFGDNTSVRVNIVAPLIPADTPSGDYYLGVLLTDVDANIANNASNRQDASPITVTCPAPATPVQLGPWDGATCLAVDQVFSWQSTAPQADYQLQVGTSCGSGTVIDLQNTSYTWYGLIYGTTYRWRVRARSQCGSWGDWSPCWTFSTDPDDSVVSTPVHPADGAHCLGSQVTLEWTPLPSADTYEVQVSSNWCYEGAITTGIVGTQHTFYSLAPNTTHYWRVRAQTVCGTTTDWSSVPGFCYTFKTAPAAIAPPDRNGPGDGTSCGNANTSLHWDHAEDWDYYEVQVDTSCGTGTIFTTSSNGFVPPDLESDVVYYWRVRTHHECGLVSDWTDCWSFSLDLEPPTNPTSLGSYSHDVETWSGDETVDTQWDWGWDNCAGSWPQYATLWDRSPLTEPTDPTTSGESTLETSPPLADAQDHWFHVRTVDWAGNLALETLHLGPFWIDGTPPSAVPALHPCEPIGLSGDFTTFTASWDPATDVLSGIKGYSYVLDSSPLPGTQPDLIIDTPLTEVSLPMGHGIWYFRIRSFDQVNLGPVAEFGPFRSNSALPAILAPACGEVLTEGEIYQIAWEAVSDASDGSLHLSVDGGQNFSSVASLSSAELLAGVHDWSVPAEDSDQALLQVRYRNAFGVPTSTSRFFTLVAVTAVPDDGPLSAGIVLEANYPNPFNPRTTIAFELSEATTVKLAVYDMAGHLVKQLLDGESRGPGRTEIVWQGRDAAGRVVPAGVYCYRLEVGEFTQTKSMTLMK